MHGDIGIRVPEIETRADNGGRRRGMDRDDGGRGAGRHVIGDEE
jgi:hypothetical protein